MSTFIETGDSASEFCANGIDVKQEEEEFDVKIDIVEEQLLLLDKKANKKEKFLCEFIQSLEVLCDICSDDKVQRVIKLNKQERVVGTILLKKLCKLGLRSQKIFHRKIPEQSCGRCFVHLILFQKKLKKKFLEHKSRKIMHPSCSHGIECPCVSCKNQYGDLDLIIRGIETRSSPLLPTTISTMPINEESQEQETLSSDYINPQPQQQEEFLYPSTYPYPDNYSSYPHQQQSDNYPQTSDSYSADPLPTMLQEFEPQPSTSNYQEQQDTNQLPSVRKKTKKSCPHCNKQFNHTGDFRKHLRKHTKERPYVCTQCDKRFSHTSNLHRHERSHTGTRPFKCDYCNKEFNRKDKLDSHRKSKACRSKRCDK